MAHIELEVEGMTCNQCARTVNGIIDRSGGTKAHVDYLLGEARFELSDITKIDAIKLQLRQAGYSANETNVEKATNSLNTIEKKLLFSIPFSLILLAHMFISADHWLHNPYIQLLLCLPVFVLGSIHFGLSTWHALRSRTINMDILILLGSTSAFVYSIIGMLIKPENDHKYLFFETTSTIITLVFLGYVIEHRAVQKTTSALKSLIHRQPAKAKKLVQNDLNQDLEVVLASDLIIDDMIMLNVGDTVPVDGQVMHGNIHVDQSMLTGESEHIQLHQGDEILSGSIVMKGGCTARTTNPSSTSTLANIIQLAKDSRKDKPEIQKLSDQISSWFVPSILGVAILSFFINVGILQTSTADGLLRSIAVLVIACPCAMGLATPTAVSVGLGLANRFGIIVKKASDFESMQRIETMVFDKTGTLSSNRLSFTMDITGSISEVDLQSIIKSLECRSNHPIAQALTKQYQMAETIDVSNFIEKPGHGIAANTPFGLVEIGRDVSDTSRIAVIINGHLAATLTKKESLKPESNSVVEDILGQGINVHIFSGDGKEKTSNIAQELGVEHFSFEMKPKDKVDGILKLSQRSTVCMIGDGINDAPALSAAHLGISIGIKNAIASNAASVVLLDDSLIGLTRFIHISTQVVKTIKQNLFWAFSYNIVAIPLAMFGYLDPMVAALSMAFSDVVVIGNSLRLNYSLNNSTF